MPESDNPYAPDVVALRAVVKALEAERDQLRTQRDYYHDAWEKMRLLNVDLVNLLVVLVLLDDVENASPDYIREKFGYLGADPETALRALDRQNLAKVVAYYRAWHLPLPPALQRVSQEWNDADS